MKSRILYLPAERSRWTSVGTINRNLIGAYEHAFPGRIRVRRQPEGTQAHVARVSLGRGSQLIFLGEAIPSAEFLSGLTHRPELVFHLLGDFTSRISHWLSIEPELRRFSVKMICASERQGALVTRLLRGGSRDVRIVPFGVDEASFRFNPVLRRRLRAKMKLSECDRAILYGGRFSVQKNVLSLITEIAALMRGDPRIHLFLAGHFDDIGSRILGLDPVPGYYFSELRRRIGMFPEGVASRIRFLGWLDEKELASAMNGADLFASLSLHHDEDFGMAAAQSICCGTPSVLTDWGGHASLARMSRGVDLLPVRFWRGFPAVDGGEVRSALVTALEQEGRKKALSHSALRVLSLTAIAKRLRAALATPVERDFAGFVTSRARQAVELFGPGRPWNARKQACYHEVYGKAYVEHG